MAEPCIHSPSSSVYGQKQSYHSQNGKTPILLTKKPIQDPAPHNDCTSKITRINEIYGAGKLDKRPPSFVRRLDYVNLHGNRLMQHPSDDGPRLTA